MKFEHFEWKYKRIGSHYDRMNTYYFLKETKWKGKKLKDIEEGSNLLYAENVNNRNMTNLVLNEYFRMIKKLKVKLA